MTDARKAQNVARCLWGRKAFAATCFSPANECTYFSVGVKRTFLGIPFNVAWEEWRTFDDLSGIDHSQVWSELMQSAKAKHPRVLVTEPVDVRAMLRD